MITKITAIQELKQMFLEIFLNKTDKITDVSQESVLNGIAYGVAKIGQKILVNQALIEGHIFPDTAHGEYLDNLALIRGVSERFTARGSSTYIRLVAEEGTTYLASTHKFYSVSGVEFELENDVTIGQNGFSYGKIKSTSVGLNTNVDPISINRINPTLTGHISCTNEYRATGGRDLEDDDLFRKRIKESPNQLARNTLSYLEQIFIKINNNVLKLMKGGYDFDSKLILIVIPVNGVDFTENEFNELISKSKEYLSLSDQYYVDSDSSLNLKNVNWQPIDIDFRVDVDPSFDVDLIRKTIQIEQGKLFDYRYWKDGDKIEWDNLLFAARGVEGVRYVPDTNFYPSYDINVAKYRLPRIRGFVLRDLNGNIISDNSGVLNDFYYPNEPDYSYQSSVASTI